MVVNSTTSLTDHVPSKIANGGRWNKETALSKSNSLTIKEKWLDPKSLSLPPGTDKDVVDKILIIPPYRMAFEVIMPSGCNAPEDFDFRKESSLQKLKKDFDKAVGERVAYIVRMHDEDREGEEKAYENAKKAVEEINSLLEDAITNVKVQVRTLLAKMLGGKTKPDHLMTVGTSSQKKVSLQRGVFESESNSSGSELLDLQRALKRKKWQYCGIAWKGSECVLTVRPKKPFKEADLKELRETLPDNARQGAHKIAAMFKAESKTNVAFKFKEGEKPPRRRNIVHALKVQTNTSVHVAKKFGRYTEENVSQENASDKTQGKATKKSSK